MDQTHSLSPIHLHAHFHQLTIANVASNDYVKSYYKNTAELSNSTF